MPFPRRLLNDHETLVLDLHPHWWFYGTSLLWTAAALLGGMFVVSRTDGTIGTLLGYLALAAIIVASATLVVRVVKWRTTYFVVTSQRLIYRQGVLARDGVEIPLDRVNNVNFSQSIFERLLGAGDLLIESGGLDGQQRFGDVAHPERVQNIIHSTIRSMRSGVDASELPLTGIAAEIAHLAELRDRGDLTDAEFEEQKRRLLG